MVGIGAGSDWDTNCDGDFRGWARLLSEAEPIQIEYPLWVMTIHRTGNGSGRGSSVGEREEERRAGAGF